MTTTPENTIIADNKVQEAAPQAAPPATPTQIKPKSKLELKGEASRAKLDELQKPAEDKPAAPAPEPKPVAVVEEEDDDLAPAPSDTTESPAKRRISAKTEAEIERRVAEQAATLRKEMMDLWKMQQAPVAPAQPVAPAAEPKKYNLDALMNEKFTEELPSFVKDEITKALQPFEQFQVQTQLEQVGSQWDTVRTPIEERDAEFKQAREFLLDNQRNVYKQARDPNTGQPYSDAQINKQLRMDEAALVAEAQKANNNPMGIAYEIKRRAYNTGFNFVAPVPAPAASTPQPTLTEQRKVKEDAPLSLNGIGSGGGLPAGDAGFSQEAWNKKTNRERIGLLPGIKEALAQSARK